MEHPSCESGQISKQETLRDSTTTLPVEDGTLPVEDATLPVESITLLVEDVTLPVENTTLPVENFLSRRPHFLWRRPSLMLLTRLSSAPGRRSLVSGAPCRPCPPAKDTHTRPSANHSTPYCPGPTRRTNPRAATSVMYSSRSSAFLKSYSLAHRLSSLMYNWRQRDRETEREREREREKERERERQRERERERIRVLPPVVKSVCVRVCV